MSPYAMTLLAGIVALATGAIGLSAVRDIGLSGYRLVSYCAAQGTLLFGGVGIILILWGVK